MQQLRGVTQEIRTPGLIFRSSLLCLGQGRMDSDAATCQQLLKYTPRRLSLCDLFVR